MRDISQSQWVKCDLARRYVGLKLSQHSSSTWNLLALIHRNKALPARFPQHMAEPRELLAS